MLQHKTYNCYFNSLLKAQSAFGGITTCAARANAL